MAKGHGVLGRVNQNLAVRKDGSFKQAGCVIAKSYLKTAVSDE